MIPAELRDRIAADYSAVRPLPSPWLRTMWIAPLAALAMFAAPVYFNVRTDAERLGPLVLWGGSLLQACLGLLVIAAALRESIPGRSWSSLKLTLWIATPLAIALALTIASWELSPVILQRGTLTVGLICLGGSASTALPIVAAASILAARGYPTRPGIAGLLLGLGAGLAADAGWRAFCHFSEPAHVLPAHLGGVALAAVIGAMVSIWLSDRLRES